MKTVSYFKFAIAMMIGTTFSGEFARAELAAELKLSIGVSADTRGTTHHRTGTIKCNPFGRDPETESFGPERRKAASSAGDKIYTASETASYPVIVDYLGGGRYVARDFKVGIERAAGDSKLSLELQDSIAWKHSINPSGACSNSHFSAATKEDVISGEIALVYKVPAGVWAFYWAVERTEDLKLASLGKIEGALRVGPPGHDGKRVVWAKPGAEVRQKIAFKNLNLGRAARGRLVFEASRIGAPQPVAEFGHLAKLMSVDELRGCLASGCTEKTMKMAMESLLGLVASGEMRQQVLKVSRTDQVAAFTGELYKIANATRPGPLVFDVKAAALFAAYSIASDLLRDFAPYCEMTQIDGAVDGRKIEVRGLKLVWFFLSQARARIKYYRFGRYRAIFDEIASMEKAGLTYEQVVTDKERLARLRKAYEVLRTMDLSRTPFAGAASDLEFIASKFRSIGQGSSSMQSILETLRQLSALERGFVKDTMSRFLAFRKGNVARIAIGDLLGRLDSIESSQDKALYLLDNSVQFLSFDSGSDEGFATLLATLISHNVEILTKPLIETELDSIRAEFVSANPTGGFLNKIYQCLE